MISLLAYEQTLPLHPSSIKSAIAASRIFLSVYDDPELRSGSSKRRVKGGAGKSGSGAGEAGAGPQLTDAEKKAKKKAKKAAAQAQKKEKEKEKEDGKDGKKVAGKSEYAFLLLWSFSWASPCYFPVSPRSQFVL